MKTFKQFLEEQDEKVNNFVAKHAQQFAKGAGKHGKTNKAKRRKEKVAMQKQTDY